MGVLTADQVRAGMDNAKLAKRPIGQYLRLAGLVSSQQLCKALSLQWDLPVVDLPNANVPVAARYVHLLDVMAQFELVPFSETDKVVCLAAKRPPSPVRMGDLERAFKKAVRVCLAPDEQIAAVLNSLGVGRPAQRRRHARHKITMPVWLQLCTERNETLGPKQGGQILDISLTGLKVEAPVAMMDEIKQLQRSEVHVLVRFSTPPLEVFGSCAVRYVKQKDNSKAWESVCILGLELKTLGPAERESFRRLHERAEIGTQRLEVEFGPQGD